MTDQEYVDWWNSVDPQEQGDYVWHSHGRDVDLLIAFTTNPSRVADRATVQAIKNAHDRCQSKI